MKQYFSIENWDKQFVNLKKPFSNKIWFAERNKTYKKIARFNIGAIMQGLPVCVDGKPCDHVFNTNIKP